MILVILAYYVSQGWIYLDSRRYFGRGSARVRKGTVPTDDYYPADGYSGRDPDGST
eukprot:gene1276-1444_t